MIYQEISFSRQIFKLKQKCVFYASFFFQFLIIANHGYGLHHQVNENREILSQIHHELAGGAWG
jgi:hypothetical protein